MQRCLTFRVRAIRRDALLQKKLNHFRILFRGREVEDWIAILISGVQVCMVGQEQRKRPRQGFVIVIPGENCQDRKPFRDS